MNADYDILAEVLFNETDNMFTGEFVKSGIRLDHRVKTDYLTCGEHHYIENEKAYPGIPTMAFINFIQPSAYPSTMFEGKIIELTRGSKVIGKATVKEVFNEQLQKSS